MTTSGTNSSFDSSNFATDNESSAVNSIVNPEKKKGALDIIKERKTYGPVCSTNKSSKELESLLLTFNEETQVYEDDNYIYNFDPDGILIEMLNKKSSSKVTESANIGIIKQISEKLFNFYYSERKINEYDNSITENENTLPKWIVDFKKNSETIRMTFDENGELLMLIVIGGGYDSCIVSKKQAIEIALTEIQTGKYGIPHFRQEEVSIAVEVKYDIDKEPYYHVFIKNIPLKKDIMTYVSININSVTGEILGIEY